MNGRIPKSITNKQPVTATIAKSIGYGVFSDLTIIHVNHLLADILDFNLILHKLGATVIFVPVIYGKKNTKRLNNLPYKVILPSGITDKSSDLLVDVAELFTIGVKEAVASALVYGSSLPNPKVLIIEDGGYHYEIKEPLNKIFLGSVEQTVSGLQATQKYFNTNSRFHHPVISIARSQLKIRFENHFIALRVIEELSLFFYQLNEFLALKNVLLIGYGIIGRSLGYLLRDRYCHVKVYDIDQNLRNVAQEEGFSVLDDLNTNIYQTPTVVIGVTGFPSFGLNHLMRFLDSDSTNIYLASASSKRIEFSEIIDYFEGTDVYRKKIQQQYLSLNYIDKIRLKETPIGFEYIFNYYGNPKKVILFAEGYPVNFFRYRSESLPSRIVDVINAELLMLVKYIYLQYNKLDNRLYLLGRDKLEGFDISETEILSLWCSLNGLSNCNGDLLEKVFSAHPCEKVLLNRW